MIIGINFDGSIAFQRTSKTGKTIEIVVQLFKNEDRQKDIRNQIQRSLGSIFHELVLVFGDLAVILEVFGSPKLKTWIFLWFSYDRDCPRSKSRAKVGGDYVVSGALYNQFQIEKQ